MVFDIVLLFILVCGLAESHERSRGKRATLSSEYNEKVALFTEDINAGQIIKAATKYLNLHNREIMKEAIARSFSGDNLENLLLLSEELPTLILRADVIASLTSKINENDNFAFYGLRVRLYVNDRYSRLALDNATKSTLDGLTNVFEALEVRAIKYMTQQIRDSNYDPLKVYAEKYPDILSKYLTNIVNSEYNPSSPDTAYTLLDFSNSLPKIHHSSRILIELNNRIVDAKLTMPLAIRIAREINILRGYDNYKNIAQDQKDGLDEIMNRIPESARAIGAGYEVCIRNVETNGLLHVQAHHDDDRDTVTASTDPPVFLSKKWVFVEDGGEPLRYQIKSEPNSDSLYAAHNGFAYDENRRRLFTWRPSTLVIQGRWELHDHNWKSNEYYIYNQEHKEYLNTDGSDTFKPAGFLTMAQSLLSNKKPNIDIFERRAYTWRGGNKGDRPTWKITDCRG